MDQLIEFAGNHALLVGAFIAVAAALLWNIAFDRIGRNAVGPAEAINLINHEDALVVDVRSMAEFRQGHIINALNLPLNGFAKQVQQIEKHKSRPVIACCRSGSRSRVACRALEKAGFDRVHNLRGGMMAWESASLPIKRGNKERKK
jgi:rhodanese-related sulfurtransferase